ncbi:MAG: LPS export ABC transporter permease LptF [Nitrospinaceae bacterium]|nr:MAG: LPS export ABC transporter permease LptF [Nitrospinaceae bacterium]
MKTIHRYIFIELLKIFSISVLFLTTIFLLEQMLYMAQMLASRGITFMEGLKLMVFTCPVFMVLSFPLSVLVAPVTVFNQLCGDNEYVAMKTSGWSFLYLMRPVILFSLIVYMATNFVVFYAIPWGTHSFKETIFDIIQKRAHIDIKPKIFNNDFQNLVLYANDKKGDEKLIDVFVADNSEEGTSKVILAKEGVIISDPENYKIKIQFQDGTVHDVTENGKSYNILNFDRYERYLEIPSMEKLKDKLVERQSDVSYTDLKEKIRKKRAMGKSANKARTRLSKNFSIPFSCLIFGLAGAALGIKSSRSGKSGGVIVSAIIAALYYITLIFSQNMGAHGVLQPTFSVWVPNIWLALLTFYFVWKTAKERPMTLFTRISDASLDAGEFLSKLYAKISKKSIAERQV